jgi:hypothetical protein
MTMRMAGPLFADWMAARVVLDARHVLPRISRQSPKYSNISDRVAGPIGGLASLLQPFADRMAAIPAVIAGDTSGRAGVSISATAAEEIGMSPGASSYGLTPDKPQEDGGVALALVIAILFVAVAAISFAVDQSVTLSSLPTGG